MLPRRNPTRRALMPALLVTLLTGCGNVSTSYLPPPEPPKIPQLPAVARVSRVEIPLMCSSTCSAGLTKLRESWLTTPTNSKQPVWPASVPMTR